MFSSKSNPSRRPTYKFQARRARSIWKAPLP